MDCQCNPAAAAVSSRLQFPDDPVGRRPSDSQVLCGLPGRHAASIRFLSVDTVSSPVCGFPGCRPRFLAAATPSRARSRIRRRSKWVIAPKTWNTSSPAAEAVEPGQAKPVSGASMVDQLSKPGTLEFPSRHNIGEDMDHAGFLETILLSGQVLTALGTSAEYQSQVNGMTVIEPATLLHEFSRFGRGPGRGRP